MNKVRELSANIISLFEELLEENDISIPDDERNGEEGEARIFGQTYYDLEDRIVDLMEESEIISPIFFEEE